MTTEKQRLLKVKATLKRRQPKFIRQDAHKRSMKEGWRAPKGLHSKIGDNRKGYRKGLKGGYQTPVAVRGLDKNGLRPTHVETVKHLGTLDPKAHSIIVGGQLGGRKKLILIEAAKSKGFALLNASDKTVARIKDAHAAGKARAAQRVEKAKAKAADTAAAGKKEKTAEAKAEAKADHKHAAAAHPHAHASGHDHAHDRKEKTE